MKPRLASSKKWTAFPQEYIKQIRDVFSQNFAEHLAQGKLLVEGRIYPEEILMRIGFLENGRIAQANFEASMQFSKENPDAVERIYDCIDALASMMEQHFSAETSLNFPRTWKEFDFGGKSVFLQFSSENSELEAEANRLLGVDESALLNEDQDSEDAIDHAESIDTTEDDSEILRVEDMKHKYKH